MAPPEKILVIGGQGPAGSWIAKVLIEQGIGFVLLDRRPDNSTLARIVAPEDLPAIERAFEDPGDPDAVARVIERRRITRLIHLGGAPGAGLKSALAALRISMGKLELTAYASGPAGEGEDDARRHFLDHRLASIGIREVETYGVGRELSLAGSLTRAIKAAVLDRRFTIPFTGTVVAAYAEDVARAFIASVLGGASAALAIKPRTEQIPVRTFIENLAKEVPESAGRITARGEPLPEEILIDETGLDDLPGVAGVPPTSIEEGIRRTTEHFRRLADEGRLREDR